MTEIRRISVIMYVSDQFVYGKLQLTDYRDPSSKVGVLVEEKVKRQEKKFKSAKMADNLAAPPPP